SNGDFEVGDLIVTDNGIFCGVIIKREPSGGNFVYTLANNTYTGSSFTANVRTTKNPPYNKDAYDGWGMYKSDFNATLAETNENLARQSNAVSGRASDAWCLRSITSGLGATIDIAYEADTYRSSVM